jgi:hypothetical protein
LNELLRWLDITLGFPNKISSSVKKVWRGYDQRTNEHVFVLHYRIKVNPGIRLPAKKLGPRRRSMPMIRELMPTKFTEVANRVL